MSSNELVSVFATFFVTTSVIWVAFFVVGKALLIAMNNSGRDENLAAVYGMSIVSLIGGLAATVGVSARVWSIGLLVCAVAMAMWKRVNLAELLPTAATSVRFLLSAIIVTVFFAPAINRFGVNLFSLGNQDIMGYALDVKHLVNHGYADYGNILNYDAGWRSQWDWAGTKLIGAFATSITGGAVVNSMTPLMATVLTQTVMSSAEVVTGSSTRFTLRFFSPALVAVAILYPLGGHVYGNYLLGQTVALSFGIAILSLALTESFRTSGIRFFILFSGMMAAWSVAGLLVCGLVAVFCVASIPTIWRIRSALLSSTRDQVDRFVTAAWLPVILGLSGFIWAVKMGLVYTTSAAGWQLPTNSFFDLLGFTHDVFIGSPRSEHLWGAAALILVLVSSVWLGLRRGGRDVIREAKILFALILVLAMGWMYYGSTVYSFWKMQSLIWPVIVLMLLRFVFQASHRRFVFTVICVAAMIVSAHALMSTSKLWSTSNYTLAIDPAIRSLRNESILQSYDEIQLDLGGGWVEMSAMAIIESTTLRSVNDTFFPKLPRSSSPRIVAGTYIPLPNETSVPLSSGFQLITSTSESP